MTDTQRDFLIAFAEYNGVPSTFEDTTTLASNILYTTSNRMRFSTLVREGIAWFTAGTTKAENTVGLTESGFRIYQWELTQRTNP